MTPQPASPFDRGFARRLLTALLLLFGATIAAPTSGALGAPHHATPSANTAEAERAHHGVLRATFLAVRAVQPKGSGGGKDLLPALAVQTFERPCSNGLRSAAPPSLGGQGARAFQARAPPFVTA